MSQIWSGRFTSDLITSISLPMEILKKYFRLQIPTPLPLCRIETSQGVLRKYDIAKVLLCTGRLPSRRSVCLGLCTHAEFSSVSAAGLINCAFKMISTLPLWEDGPQKCFYLGARLIEKQARQANEIKFIREKRNMKDIFKAHRSSLESHLVKWVRNFNHEKGHNDHILYVYIGSSGSSGLLREANKHEI